MYRDNVNGDVSMSIFDRTPTGDVAVHTTAARRLGVALAPCVGAFRDVREDNTPRELTTPLTGVEGMNACMVCVCE